jgi:hypothetical protein
MDDCRSSLLFAALLAVAVCSATGYASTVLDVYDSSDLLNPIGQIQTIETAQTGAQHYNYYSASGHPSGVNTGQYRSNLWVHENANNGDYSFGFIFGADSTPAPANEVLMNFRIVDSATDVYVAQSDDPGEAVETTPGAFVGDYWYRYNSDGLVVSGVTGNAWTIIVDSVDFGNITDWYAASGETSGFGDDLTLAMGNEYRITPQGNPPSGAPVIPEPSTVILMGTALAGAAAWRRRKRGA